MPEYKPKVKFFVSTKAELATNKVNEWLEENYDHIDVIGIQPFMSYTTIKDSGAYMIGCLVQYLEVPKDRYMPFNPEDKPVEAPLTYGMNFSEE